MLLVRFSPSKFAFRFVSSFVLGFVNIVSVVLCLEFIEDDDFVLLHAVQLLSTNRVGCQKCCCR